MCPLDIYQETVKRFRLAQSKDEKFDRLESEKRLKATEEYTRKSLTNGVPTPPRTTIRDQKRYTA